MTYLEMIIEQAVLTEEYYELVLLENKWKKMLAAGKLSKNSIKRIKAYRGDADPLYVKKLLKDGKKASAIQYLKKKGIVTPVDQWIKGVERGTKNILDKMGATVTDVVDSSRAKSMGLKPGDKLKSMLQAHGRVHPSGKAVMHVPSKYSRLEKPYAHLVKRHEADELRTAKKLMKKHKKMVSAPALPQFHGHASRDVIDAERKLVNTAKGLYGYKGGGHHADFARKRISGEYQPGALLSKAQEKLRRKQYFDMTPERRELLSLSSAKERKELLAKWKKEFEKDGLNKKDVRLLMKRYIL